MITLSRTQNHLLIIDDRAGRDAAATSHVRFIGTAGVVIRAKQAGMVSAAAPVLDQLAATGIRLASDIRKCLLAQVGE